MGCFFVEAATETLGTSNSKTTYPGKLKIVKRGKISCLEFDISSLKENTKVYSASLFCFISGGVQPTEKIEIYKIDSLTSKNLPVYSSKALQLEKPYYRSFNMTDVVREWVQDPGTNKGVAVVKFGGFDAQKTYLEICYEGKSKKEPPQVQGLKAIYQNGQTFLVFKEIPEFRPPKDKIKWVNKMAPNHWDTKLNDKPGDKFKGVSPIPAVTLKELRDLQGLSVRDKPLKQKTQRWPPFKVLKKLPKVTYRVYRHTERITPGNLVKATVVGETKPLTAYRKDLAGWKFVGEYYWPHELPISVIPTIKVGGDTPVLPGENFYVNTVQQDGKFYYAVTTVYNGTENCSEISDANSLVKSVDEKVAIPQPVIQYVKSAYWRNSRSKPTTQYWYMYWLAPPYSNVPDNNPRMVIVTVPLEYKAPGPIQIKTGPTGRFFGPRSVNTQTMELLIQQDLNYGGDLAYNTGKNTLLSYRESKIGFYSEKYLFSIIDWALKKWDVDKSRIFGKIGLHFGIRHPEFFPRMTLGVPDSAGYTFDFDQKWNPGSRALYSKLGPSDIVKTKNGSPGWNLYDMTWYLKQNPGKDIPFMSVVNSQPKDGNHGAEFGWQDDPKGWAALRDARQPYVAGWSGGRPDNEVTSAFAKLDWTKTMPAFSNCTLDNNPGSGDPDDGEPFGQINGYLIWDSKDTVDKKDKWEMTITLVKGAPAEKCEVDLTPRHRKLFNPKPGTIVKFSSTDLVTGKELHSGSVKVDKWGLSTIKGLKVVKGKQRVNIWKDK